MILDRRMFICHLKSLTDGDRAYGVTENTPPTQSLNLAYEVLLQTHAFDSANFTRRATGDMG
jgi:hypothetical protein